MVRHYVQSMACDRRNLMALTIGRILQQAPTIEKLVERLNRLFGQVDRGINRVDRKAYYARRRQRLVGGE